MTGQSLQQKRASREADPILRVLALRQSEFQHVGHAEDKRVNVDRSDRRTVDRNICVDVDPAHIGAQGAAVTQSDVYTGVQGQAKGIVKVKCSTGQRPLRRFVKEMRVVHTDTDKWRQIRVVGKVVLQRQGGRQVFGVPDLPSPGKVDVMLKWPGHKQLQADAVGDEVLKRQSRANVGINVDQASRRCAARAIRCHRVQAEPKREVALRLRKGRSGRTTQRSGKGQGSQFCHFVSHLTNLTPILPRRSIRHFDSCQNLLRTEACCPFATPKNWPDRLAAGKIIR